MKFFTALKCATTLPDDHEWDETGEETVKPGGESVAAALANLLTPAQTKPRRRPAMNTNIIERHHALTLVILSIAVVVLLWRYGVASKALSILRKEAADLTQRFNALRAAKDEKDSENAHLIGTLREQLSATEAERASLSQFVDIRDTAVEAERIRTEAAATLASAESKATESIAVAGQEAARLLADATFEAKQKRSDAEQMV